MDPRDCVLAPPLCVLTYADSMPARSHVCGAKGLWFVVDPHKNIYRSSTPSLWSGYFVCGPTLPYAGGAPSRALRLRTLR
jgi:hypothetical protein